MQKPGVSRLPSTLNALTQSPYQPVNTPLNQSGSSTSIPTSLALIIFMAALPFNFRFCNLPLVCHSNFEKCSAQNQGFRRHESSLCHKHAVTMLTQPGHVDEQLKEWLKSEIEENRNCLLKIESIFYLS